jgi:hypothetical protein
MITQRGRCLPYTITRVSPRRHAASHDLADALGPDQRHHVVEHRPRPPRALLGRVRPYMSKAHTAVWRGGCRPVDTCRIRDARTSIVDAISFNNGASIVSVYN